jgi:hypothetical protein
MKQTAVCKWATRLFSEGRGSVTKKGQDGQQQAELKKTLQKIVKCYMKIVG